MSKSKSYTIEYTGKLLFKNGYIDKIQLEYILSEALRVEKELKKDQANKYLNKFNQTDIFISPAEIISSLDIKSKKNKNKFSLSEDNITELISKDIDVSYKKIDPLKLDSEIVTSFVPLPFAIRHLIVPVEKKGDEIYLAVCDPFNMEPVESLKSARKINIIPVLCSKNDIIKTVNEFYGYRASVTAAEAEFSTVEDLGNLEQYLKLKGNNEIEANDQHIVNAVEHLLKYAFDQRASDIHIEPKRERSEVRLRIDGVMHSTHTMPITVHAPMLARLKMLSRMNIAEKRKPQDGRIKTNYSGKDIELRVSTMPVAFGEKIVVRIFDPDVLLHNVSTLGFYERECELYDKFIKKPNGILLVTGPTGSGKTTTLYSTLKSLASPDINIVTIEDPIEMVMEDFNQVAVRSEIGVTFASILRTILRQDPDIIMVGEIRDKETAENAIQSALTGHLVLSTLHTNDAPSSIVRLIDMGIPHFLIASTLIGVVAQRLVRKICVNCKVSRKLEADEINYLQLEGKNHKVYYGEGCNECRGTGYKGRTGIFEVLEVTDSIKSKINEKTDLKSLSDNARQSGMMSLKECAVRHMLEGITTYEEVIAVTG